MEFLRRLFPHRPTRALETREVIPIPVDILLVGSLYSDTPDTTPIKNELILPPATTSLLLGQTRLVQIATIDPDGGLGSIQFTSRSEMRRGKSLTLPEGILIAIPYPKFALVSDGRIYYDSQYINCHEERVEKDRKINAVRQVIQYRNTYTRQLHESANHRQPSS